MDFLLKEKKMIYGLWMIETHYESLITFMPRMISLKLFVRFIYHLFCPEYFFFFTDEKSKHLNLFQERKALFFASLWHIALACWFSCFMSPLEKLNTDRFSTTDFL